MRIEQRGAVATVTVDTYSDLLKVRALPEWRFVGPRMVETTAEHLALAGLAPQLVSARYGTPGASLFDIPRPC